MKTTEASGNVLRLYPIPAGVVLQQDYILRIRPLGAEEWQWLPAYQVKVDMHDVRTASMVYFDFTGKVELEITFPKFFHVYQVDIRPLSLQIPAKMEPKKVTIVLEKPANLSVEINRDRFHNLHVFAGPIEEIPNKEGSNVLVVKGSLEKPGILGNDLSEQLRQMEPGRLLYIEAGLYYISECIWNLPSHTRIYMEGGAVLLGGLAFSHGENLQISGRGVLCLRDFARFTCINGIRMDHSKNISLDGLIFINPPHYTISLGCCEQVKIHNVKSFSCEGWSDGLDMMSCRDVTASGCFLRTSDDCVAIYGSRWDNRGGSSHIVIRDSVVWADVAHPLMIGTHGDYEHDGDLIEDILFENIDVLEHHEFQPGYLGALAINAGDKNLVRNVTYRNIRIEPFEHGKVLDFQVKWNKDYNPAPGKGIENILLEDIGILTGNGEEPSVIAGYSEEFAVKDITIRNMRRNGRPVETLDEANIRVGAYAKDIRLL